MKHNRTKVMLSANELELVTNAQILLTKNEIIKKVYALFGLLAEEFVEEATFLLPEAVTAVPPKISRGENYKGLPYVMLDYPRTFKKDETFAIRTFFWWGNFFSITLQLSGSFKTIYSEALSNAIRHKVYAGWFIGIGADAWQHHFQENNYVPVENNIDFSGHDFVKLAKKIPLKEWDDVQFFLKESFSAIIRSIKS